MKVTQVLGLGVFSASVFAQAATYSSDNIDPNAISLTTRSQWCVSQINTCTELCGATNTNTCDDSTLGYSCLCASNSSSPALAIYTGTLPTFICEYEYQNCTIAAANDAAAQSICKTNEKNNCGHLDPAQVAASSSSSSLPKSSHAHSHTASVTKHTSNASQQSIPVVNKTETITPSPTGTTTVLVTSTSTPGQSALGNGTSGGFATTIPANVTFTTGVGAGPSSAAVITAASSVPNSGVSANGARVKWVGAGFVAGIVLAL